MLDRLHYRLKLSQQAILNPLTNLISFMAKLYKSMRKS